MVQDGLGLLTVQYLPDEPAVAYRIEATHLAEYSIEFSLRPLEKDAEAIFLRGEGDGSSLRLEVGGTNGYWQRRLLLEREAAVTSRIEAVEKRAAEFAEQAKANKTMEPTW